MRKEAIDPARLYGSTGDLRMTTAICSFMLAVSQSLRQTWSTSPLRATIWYRTGLTMRPRNSLETRPATMTMAKGRCESDPMPCEKAAGSRPRQATSAVIMMGRRRTIEASKVALAISCPSSRSLLM